MPLSDYGSYVLVMDEVALHWDNVDAELGGTPETALKLEGGFDRADFIAAKNDLNIFLIGFEDMENAREIAAGERDNWKETLRQKLGQFRGILRAVLPKSKYAAAAPLLPNFGADESKFLTPFDDAASLWLRINADTTIAGFTPPLMIAGMTQTLFAADITAARASYHAIRVAENDLNVARKERQTLLDDARERMVQYRSVVEGLLGPEHPLTQSLPVLSSAPGSTPDAVTANGHWEPMPGHAMITWNASTNPNLNHYEVRMSPGDTYSVGDAVIIANIPSGQGTVFQTLEGLATPGSVATFKVYVVLTTGNESGSNAVTITRP